MEEEGREESTGRLETKVPTAMLHIYNPFLKGQRQEDLDFHTSLGDKPDPTTKKLKDWVCSSTVVDHLSSRAWV